MRQRHKFQEPRPLDQAGSAGAGLHLSKRGTAQEENVSRRAGEGVPRFHAGL